MSGAPQGSSARGLAVLVGGVRRHEHRPPPRRHGEFGTERAQLLHGLLDDSNGGVDQHADDFEFFGANHAPGVRILHHLGDLFFFREQATVFLHVLVCVDDGLVSDARALERGFTPVSRTRLAIEKQDEPVEDLVAILSAPRTPRP